MYSREEIRRRKAAARRAEKKRRELNSDNPAIETPIVVEQESAA